MEAGDSLNPEEFKGLSGADKFKRRYSSTACLFTPTASEAYLAPHVSETPGPTRKGPAIFNYTPAAVRKISDTSIWTSGRKKAVQMPKLAEVMEILQNKDKTLQEQSRELYLFCDSVSKLHDVPEKRTERSKTQENDFSATLTLGKRTSDAIKKQNRRSTLGFPNNVDTPDREREWRPGPGAGQGQGQEPELSKSMSVPAPGEDDDPLTQSVDVITEKHKSGNVLSRLFAPKQVIQPSVSTEGLNSAGAGAGSGQGSHEGKSKQKKKYRFSIIMEDKRSFTESPVRTRKKSQGQADYADRSFNVLDNELLHKISYNLLDLSINGSYPTYYETLYIGISLFKMGQGKRVVEHLEEKDHFLSDLRKLIHDYPSYPPKAKISSLELARSALALLTFLIFVSRQVGYDLYKNETFLDIATDILFDKLNNSIAEVDNDSNIGQMTNLISKDIAGQATRWIGSSVQLQNCPSTDLDD